jgi:cytidylate kinase
MTAFKPSSELMAEAFERAREQCCTIAISRERGTGGSAIARLLGEQLGWPVYDRELLERISDETGLRTELLESFDEKRSYWLVECLEAFAGARSISGPTYAHRLAECMLALSAHGHAVIVGRGAAAILPEATTLRVRLLAPFEDRVAHLCNTLGMSEATARRQIEKTDGDRAAFVKQHFGGDVTDVGRYDLVINTARFSAEQAVEIIIAALRQRESQVQAPLTPR